MASATTGETEMVRPNVARVVLLFVACFGGILWLFAAAFAMTLLWPPPLEINRAALTPEWMGTRTLPGGVRVEVRRFRDAAAADAAYRRLPDDAPSSSRTNVRITVIRYTTDRGRRGQIAVIGDTSVRIDTAAQTDGEVDEMMARLPFIVTHENPLAELLDHHIVAVLVGLGAYSLLFLLWMGRAGSWAGTMSPPAGIAAVSADELRRRLLALNDLDVPIRVREAARGFLVAEWRIADAKWTSILERGGLKIQHQVKMKLDPRRPIVRTVDIQRSLRWMQGVASVGLSFTFFRGIVFLEYGLGSAYGVVYRDGRWTVDALYRYGYSLNELKAPVVQAIIGSGWTYKPVVTFIRPLGG